MHRKKFVIIIPSRIGSTRLANKPLAKIGPRRLIEHLLCNLIPDFADNLYVATDSQEIAEVVGQLGVSAIMTQNCPTGTDRVYQASLQLDSPVDYIINVQGDMPFIGPNVIWKILERLERGDCDIATATTKVGREVADGESNVKVIIDKNDHALYFSRSLIPNGGQEFDYHIGIYGFTRMALEHFVKIPQTNYETSERLEQLRALEHGMKIGICRVDEEPPISVDTPHDLEKAIEHYHKISR